MYLQTNKSRPVKHWQGPSISHCQPRLEQIVKARVIETLSRRQPLRRIIHEDPLQQVNQVRRRVRRQLLLHRRCLLWEPAELHSMLKRPQVILRWRPNHLHDLRQLPNIRRPDEHRHSRSQHLRHNAPRRPHVNRCRVRLAIKNQLRRPIITRRNVTHTPLPRVQLLCASKVANLQLPGLCIYQNVFGLDIAVRAKSWNPYSFTKKMGGYFPFWR